MEEQMKDLSKRIDQIDTQIEDLQYDRKICIRERYRLTVLKRKEEWLKK
jgi:cell division protein FtsB